MNEQKQTLSIPVAIIIAGALIAFGIYWSGRGDAPTEPVQAVNTSTAGAVNIEPIGADDHVLGDRKAPIVIVEYSDLECPFCKQYHATLNQLMDTYGVQGKLAWAFRHFPVHTNSVKEGEAVECAAEIGGNEAFWKYTDKVFELTKSNNGLDLNLLPQIAAQLGLDEAKFKTCLDSGKYTAKIEKDRQDVLDAGAQGTPYSVIFAKGEKIPLTQGALPYADMKTILDEILR
jgi:protein-disulfide isomerase